MCLPLSQVLASFGHHDDVVLSPLIGVSSMTAEEMDLKNSEMEIENFLKIAPVPFYESQPLTNNAGNPLLGLDGKTLEERVLVNPLDWWRMNAGLFPALSVIARRTLCIPATSAPSERLFSSAGSVVSPKRTKLDPHLTADMILLHEVKDLFRKL